ncbi:DUF484 family protein [Limibaculum sp. M0105]|uniref:DUF484 family protein n=1 Tax=Thermohalobaculum xanthum TaxID=2753746 RepID=A0A8J7M8Q5_9RHOB|nr:DUF484 family protein [Thermohalobaculum xanthum]MBK0400684.1 DUF484 family protein [Thermohalobaculum xanthum]
MKLQDPSADQAKKGGVELDSEERDLIRSLILADPELVLSDDQVMRALIRATGTLDRNVVDLRDKLVERLEQRLSKLVHANRSVIAAAYENVASTQQVHRAVLQLLDADDLDDFLRRLTQDVPRMVSIDAVRLCLEADVEDIRPAEGVARDLGERVLALPVGMVETYLALHPDARAGRIVLRPSGEESDLLFGFERVSSEALLKLDLGGAAGLLALGSTDPDRFTPEQGTDLLEFFAGVVARLALQHLARIDPDV